VVLREIDDHHLLVRLVEYDASDWWSGYDVIDRRDLAASVLASCFC
jgi:hypothetical protein